MVLPSRGTQLLDAQAILRRVGIVSGSFVADLGCGAAGHFTFPAARLVGEQGKVYAVDIQKTILDVIQRRARAESIHNIETVHSDLEVSHATKIPQESLDLALVITVLFQTKKHDAVLREAVRLTRPKGKILMLDWKQDGTTPFAPPPALRVSPETLRTIARSLNLEEVDDFDAGPSHYALVFRKI